MYNMNDLYKNYYDNYRQYDEDGNPIKGPYAKIFEEEYEKVIRKPKYNTLIEKIEHVPVEEVHNGYFSVDKKGKVKDSRETKKGKLRANKDDESTFNLIMRDKEKLLSFDSNLKWGSKSDYDYLIDSSILGIDETINLIVDIYNKLEKQ